jgi:large subunit ribosomal protein L6
MSRIGKKPIEILNGARIEVKNGAAVVNGPKGTLSFYFSPEMEIKISEKQVSVIKKGNSKNSGALWGTTARIIENMIKGVTEGYQKQLELNGVGFRMALQGKKIKLLISRKELRLKLKII